MNGFLIHNQTFQEGKKFLKSKGMSPLDVSQSRLLEIVVELGA